MSGLSHLILQGVIWWMFLKDHSERIAIAVGFIKMTQKAYDIVDKGSAKKGDVLGVARHRDHGCKSTANSPFVPSLLLIKLPSILPN